MSLYKWLAHFHIHSWVYLQKYIQQFLSSLLCIPPPSRSHTSFLTFNNSWSAVDMQSALFETKNVTLIEKWWLFLYMWWKQVRAQKAEQRAQSQENKESEHSQWEELLPCQITFPNLRVGSPGNIYLTRFQNCYGSVALCTFHFSLSWAGESIKITLLGFGCMCRGEVGRWGDLSF